MLAADGVPIAEYTKDVLATPTSRTGDFVQRVLDKVAFREANVRAWAVRVALGEADATFVYQSDVTEDICDRLQVLEILKELNVLATYPVATVERSQNPGLARE